MSILNKRQQVFVKHYRVDRNATKAAIAAGYSEKTAYSAGARLLKHVEIQRELNRQDEKLNNKLELSAEWVIVRLMWRAGFDVRKFYREDGSLIPVHELDEQTAFALQGMDVEKLYQHFGKGQAENTGTITKIKYADRDRALELLGRHLKLFTDKVEVSGLDSIADELAKARARARR